MLIPRDFICSSITLFIYLFFSGYVLSVLYCPSLCLSARDLGWAGQVQPLPSGNEQTVRKVDTKESQGQISVINKRKQSNQESWGRLSEGWAEIWRKHKHKVILPINSKVLASMLPIWVCPVSGAAMSMPPPCLPGQCEAASHTHELPH